MNIKISTDFTDAPGARYYKDGDNSGQEFYEKILKLSFEQCVANNEKLVVDFDDCYGFPSSFLSESFGRLSDEFGADQVLATLEFISEQDPLIPSQVLGIISAPRRKINE